MPHQNSDTLVCCRCQASFAAEIDPTQAYGCASDVIVDPASGDCIVYCHYGSKFDSYRYLMPDAAAQAGGILCDECLETAIKNGQAQRVKASGDTFLDPNDEAILKKFLPFLFKNT